jgi:hypothetical protein
MNRRPGTRGRRGNAASVLQASASGGGVGTSSAGSGGGEVTRARTGAGAGRSMLALTTAGSAICGDTMPTATAAEPHVLRNGLPDSVSRRCAHIGHAHFSSPVRCAQQQEAGVSAVRSGSCMEWSVKTYTPAIASARHQGVRSADRSAPLLPTSSRVYLRFEGQVKPTHPSGGGFGLMKVALARSPHPRGRPPPAPILPDAGRAA